MKIAMFAYFKEYHGNQFKSLYDFGGRCLKNTWANNQSQHDLSCGGVSLSIS